jgi:hypothetical protein
VIPKHFSHFNVVTIINHIIQYMKEWQCLLLNLRYVNLDESKTNPTSNLAPNAQFWVMYLNVFVNSI